MKTVACLVASVGLLLVSAACETTDAPKPAAEIAPKPAVSSVFITEKSLPAGSYEFLKDLETLEAFYGGKDAAFENLAEDTAKLGGDAVIEVESWFQPSFMAWAAPAAKGKAVKLKNKDVIKGVEGKWMPVPQHD